MRKPRPSGGTRTNKAKRSAPGETAKHELLAEAIVIHGEAVDNLAALSARFHAEFHPRTQIETHHVETMIMCRWRLHRVWEFESACLNHEIEHLPSASEGQSNRTRAFLAFRNLAEQSRSLGLLNRYEAKLASTFISAHKALMDLKPKPVPDWSRDEEHSVLPPSLET